MENFSVYIRLKPLKDQSEQNFTYGTQTLTNIKTNEVFTFDSIIPPTQTTKDIFNNLVKPNISCFLKGINISLISYGQTTSGKTFTLKGDLKSNEGLIPLCLKEIFNSLKNNKESNIMKSIVKISFYEIYNENINDLIDISKKNLEIRDSPRGVYIYNLSENFVNNVDKALLLFNKGENYRINGENKFSEKISKAHNIFKINLELFIKDKNNKEKKCFSQMNFIELAGSENISKIKTEQNKIKENPNTNKSLLSFNNIILKLSNVNNNSSNINNKNSINYKESKLTRLLHNSLGGNCKTSIICTLIDDNAHFQENINTINFGIKAKSVKNNIKVNEINIDQKKMNMENQALRNKIKILEKIINDKKSIKDNKSKFMTATKNKNNSNKKYLLSTTNKNKTEAQNNEQISNLEKEVTMLKKYLMNNEELDSDIGSIQSPQDWMSNQSDLYSNRYNMSAYKPSFQQKISNLSAIRGSGSAIKNIYLNSPVLQKKIQPEFYANSNLNQIEGYNNNFKRNLCMTEMRPPTGIQKHYFYSAMRKTAPQNNNYILGSNMKFPVPDIINTSINYENNSTDFILKENEDLKKNLQELKKTYNEVVQSKEQQIILLNQNHEMTLENCEKLIKEAEANYLNLKNDYDQVMTKMKLKDDELDDLKQKNMNQDSSINYYKTELDKMKELNFASDIEAKYNSLLEENVKLKQKEEEEFTKLKEENDILKKNIEDIDNKYKEKCLELNENQKKNNEDKKQNEKELQKYKNELKNYKNNIGKKGVKNKENINPNISNNNQRNEIIKQYEDQINKLIEENTQYKISIEKIEKTQIVEYQKLLDESFAKIAQLNKELNDSKDKNKYLEKALNIVEKTARKINLSPYLVKNDNNIDLNEQKNNMNKNINSNDEDDCNKDFLSKKRKMPKEYQNLINKQDNNYIVMTPNKEINEMMNTEFSNFEI